ncbi:UDP-N-acetylglucosamine-N-acetylmuramylpentapeptide N-acetylglucosamine transferase [Desulfotomaculum arcticum]|uniref:UDP-N-acetylglucosamine--N-acetylmuramyl-(pentapeptide) pyrophosphoryl-undecaprenol N-acetylglucosamine transferase n=1 Tax=Desulfotruncus arcticus DSM 17038 TaxID=1121424 RepID=A0A1I2QIU0_9FIRM|nr:undecaprenyldiphospho-muramoylpentapeptide beta-N-acetylglucosaminyltransferase [Desulfotruncus arcticus]SFG27890.1 UDP-N-acetylglucosamine-N-acetylmuramylpentapeptide N-acetylglucosamine transferase [Desulfotomaculum arcticum] [Desulfotruncus arcticus DSM 17038]
MRFVVAGGGTGGHIYPALAIARGLQQRYPNCEIMYIGTGRGLEADIVPKAGYEFHAVRAVGIKRSLTPQNLKVPLEALAGYRESHKLIRGFAPRAVIGTGGYVCGPVLLSASRLKKPTFIHEQNALPGITNRILSRVADRVAVTFEDSLRYFPGRSRPYLTGLPVRPEILSADREKAREKFGVGAGEIMVLSFGGSQGARSINRAVAEAIGPLSALPGIKLLHVTGSGQHQDFFEMLKSGACQGDLPDNINMVPYMYEMPEALAAADLIISRAGAATLAEITARGLPSVLIPFPYATGNHQEYNARALVSRGAAEMVRDAEFNGTTLVNKLKQLLENRHELAKMAEASRGLGKPRALDDILDGIAELF